MNTNKMDQIIAKYVDKFAMINDDEHQEYFKWQICYDFPRLMDLALKSPEESFYQALREVKKRTENFIDNYTQPFSGLVKFAEEEPETVRQMFLDLYEPDNGDIVVLSKDSFLDGKMIVKRIIATEGQEIDIDFENGKVYVDGKLLDEKYINEPTQTQYTMQFPATVPKDHVFVMGDNRNHSADSRDASLGMVHKSCILGRVVLRILPISDFGAVN